MYVTIKKHFKRFADFLKSGPEDWEQVWPNLGSIDQIFDLLKSLLQNRKLSLISILSMDAVKAATIAVAMITLKKFLEPIEDDKADTAWLMLGVFLSLNLIQLFLEIFRNISLNVLSTNLVFDMRRNIYRKLLYFPLKFFHALELGYVVNHINRDVRLTVDIVTSFLINLLNSILTFIAVSAVIVYINWKVGLFTFAVMLMAIPVVQLGRSAVAKYAQRLFGLHSRLLSILQESLCAIKYLKAMGFEQRETRRINQIMDENRRLSLEIATLHQTIGPVMEFFYLLIICLALWVTIKFMHTDFKLSIIAPLVYALIRLSSPARQMVRGLIGIEENLQAARRVSGTLAYKGKGSPVGGNQPLNGRIKRIKLENLSYSYNKLRPLVKKVALELKRGEITMVMGESGTGKSTLCELIMGLHINYGGRILINDIDIKNLEPDSFRAAIGFVPQESLLIRGSVRENLLYGSDEKADDEKLIDVLKKAYAWDFVSSLDKGLESLIDERGTNLSRGEGQRVCLARALLRDPDLLILDEATASLDIDNEEKILKALQAMKMEMITVFVSHSLSPLPYVDNVISLNRGEMIVHKADNFSIPSSG